MLVINHLVIDPIVMVTLRSFNACCLLASKSFQLNMFGKVPYADWVRDLVVFVPNVSSVGKEYEILIRWSVARFGRLFFAG